MPDAKLTVAAAQIAPRLGDVDANLELADTAIAEAGLEARLRLGFACKIKVERAQQNAKSPIVMVGD